MSYHLNLPMLALAVVSTDNPAGSGQALGKPAATMLPQYRPRGADDVAVRGGGAAAPGGRTSVERLQKCKGRTDCGDDSRCNQWLRAVVAVAAMK